VKTQIKTEAHIYTICNHEFEQNANENGGSLGKNLPANAGDMSLIPGLGRSPGEGSGSPFQHSCLEISWTEEAGRVPDSPCGCKRIRHDLATKQP